MKESLSVQYDIEYKKLNTEQKEAVNSLDGPVMVIAGPGTGKTQVLALRIAHILKTTDTPPDGILCLTFTRAGVKAMQDRLYRYIGDQSKRVVIQTFHSFAISLVEKHYELLDFETQPTLLKDDDAVFLIDELLHTHDWKYLHSRGNVSMYFSDLKNLVSLLKREQLSSFDLMVEIDNDIEKLQSDPDNISSRGETKGQLKKDIQKKIDSLSRTREVATFFEYYEALKRKKAVMDYDDVLTYAVSLVREYESVRADVRENYLYVLVDEHQDSSGVQNEFLYTVWKETEKPNIFVVGDDRQLIYGFGGASLSYFEQFKTAFGKVQLITLVENYRSTAPILDLADTLLQSSLTEEKLRSNKVGTEPVSLQEYMYERDEIINAGLHFKKQIEQGLSPDECALLVPKNKHIRSAVQILNTLGVPAKSSIGISFFDVKDTQSFRNILSILDNPYNTVFLAESILDPLSNIPILVAHKFLHDIDTRKLSLETLLQYGQIGGLFDKANPIFSWGQKLDAWLTYSHTHSLLEVVHHIGNEYIITASQDHDDLIKKVEVVRTFIHIATERIEKNPKETVKDFLQYLARLEEYNHMVLTVSFGNSKGITVMTLHASKGLEYEDVWIAHMNENVLMAQKRNAFTMPARIDERIEIKNKAVAKRELYVAITRAKKSCTISYATTSYAGGSLELAEIISELPREIFQLKTVAETQDEIIKCSPRVYVSDEQISISDSVEELQDFIKKIYKKTKVSVTLLNNFFECPWKWYFRNILQLPDVKNEGLKFGSAIHKTIETILIQTKKPTNSFIKQTLEHALEHEGIVEDSIRIRLLREGLECIQYWIENSYPHLSPDKVVERSISYRDSRFPELIMYGKIDLTERFSNGTCIVTDFKTGSPKTTGMIEKHDQEGRLSSFMRQLAMYSYLITGVEKTTTVESSKLVFLEGLNDKNAIYVTTVSNEQIDLLVKDIADYCNLIESGEWISRSCQYQSWKPGEECEYCKRAKAIYVKTNPQEAL